MRPQERSASWLIEHGLLESLPTLEFEGRKLPTAMLGYRINRAFVNHFFGRIFTSPEILFEDWMLRPEEQDLAVFADGLENMLQTHQRVAENYFQDGSIDVACPPLKALLHIMRDGQYEGQDLQSESFRQLFDPRSILDSDWYQERIEARCEREKRHWKRLSDYVAEQKEALENRERLRILANQRLAEAGSDEYRQRLLGTLGLDPSLLAT